jgi:hypothetical protein
MIDQERAKFDSAGAVEQLTPLISLPPGALVGVIERAAACAMLHSFYTEVEKILKLIAREWDGQMPSSDAWHKEQHSLCLVQLIRLARISPLRMSVIRVIRVIRSTSI